MVTMYQFPIGYKMPVSVSPYCAKLELYMRLTKRDYKTEKGNVLKSPNKAVPYLRWDDGSIVVETDLIIGRFEKIGPSLDEGITEEQRKKGKQLQELAESKIYFSCLRHRFADDETWKHQKQTVLQLVPWLLSPILTRVIRKSQIKKCEEAGFSNDKDYEKGVETVKKISEALTSKFIIDDKIRTADCAVWANLASCGATYTSNPVRDEIRGDEKIMQYLRTVAKEASIKLPY